MRGWSTKVLPKMTQPTDPLRPVEQDEVDALAALWCQGWRIGHETIVPKDLLAFRTQTHFRDRISESMSDCFVIGPRGRIDGFVRLKEAELDQVYVDPSQIGQGTAARLMKAAEDLLRDRGFKDVFLIASVGNDRAIRFYEKMGWRNAGQRREGVETSDGPFLMDVIRFEKTL